MLASPLHLFALFATQCFILASPVDSSPSSSGDAGTHIGTIDNLIIPLSKTPSRRTVNDFARRNLKLSRTATTASLTGSQTDFSYVVNATLGGQTIPMVIDMGGSDLWVIQKGFQCFDPLTLNPASDAVCNLGSSPYNPSASKTSSTLVDHNFNLPFGDGTFVSGPVGLDTVTIGGVTVKSQEFGSVNRAAIDNKGDYTGYLGLSYPSLTSVYKGTNLSADGQSNFEPYDPWFFSAVKQKRFQAPVFSLALSRGPVDSPDLGSISFGGLPPSRSGHTTSKAVTVPGLTLAAGSNPDLNTTETFFLYIPPVQGYVFSGFPTQFVNHSTASSPVNFAIGGNLTFIDCGISSIYVPTHVADTFNAQFNPPARHNTTDGQYYVDCDTRKAPELGVVIGHETFPVDRKDLVIPAGKDDNNLPLCRSAVRDGGPADGSALFILGSAFLHNVVAAFDIDKHLITLLERVRY